MDLPQEIEIWHVIPLIRKLLVLELKSHGLKQKDIASKLDITGSAVSQYLNDKRAKHCNLEIPIDVKKEVSSSAQRIIDSKAADYQVIQEINHLASLFRENRLICRIHMLKDSSLKGCNICYR